MLTEEEKRFVQYWEKNRLRKKRSFRQLAVGLPMAAAIVTAIFINFFSGWYKRAEMMKNTDPSLVLVLVIAALLIVVFTAIFSRRHQWDINEQHYRELKSREEQD